MNEREKLINTMIEMGAPNDISAHHIADFILADRKRIVAPLKKEYSDEEIRYYGISALLHRNIQETLKNAGIE